MIEKIKLKKIKTNHYVDQNNDLFLIVKNNENNYDFLYLELIMMDNLENKELKFDSEIEVVNYLENRDINDFQKEVFKNYLVSMWVEWIDYDAKEINILKNIYTDKNKAKNINTIENNQLFFNLGCSSENISIVRFMLKEPNIIKKYTLEDLTFSFSNYDDGVEILKEINKGMKNETIYFDQEDGVLNNLKAKNHILKKIIKFHLMHFKERGDNEKNYDNFLFFLKENNYNHNLLKETIKYCFKNEKQYLLKEIINKEPLDNKKIWQDTFTKEKKSSELSEKTLSIVQKLLINDNCYDKKSFEEIENFIKVSIDYQELNEGITAEVKNNKKFKL
jgi:hypothetical protein